jgi:FXSXX-COOH protein
MEFPLGPTAVGETSWAPLIDVSKMPATELMTSDDSILARSIRRVIGSLDDPDGIISAFQSFTS